MLSTMVLRARATAGSGSTKKSKFDLETITLIIFAAAVAGCLIAIIAAMIFNMHPYEDFDKAIISLPDEVIDLDLNYVRDMGNTYRLTDTNGNEYVVDKDNVTLIKEVG